MRNPLYHWTHLELQRYFGIDVLLNTDSGEAIYKKTQEQLQNASHHTRGLLKQMQVEVVATTDDPIDSLNFHADFQGNSEDLKMIPSFRPDKAYATADADAYKAYIEKLAEASSIDIKNYDDFIAALQNRADFFKAQGCKASDHGLESLDFFELGNYDANQLFQKVLAGTALNLEEQAYFRFETLLHLARYYHSIGWVQQYHLGALRNTNKRMLTQLGPDTGFDSIGDYSQAVPLAQFFNLLDSTDQLAKRLFII